MTLDPWALWDRADAAAADRHTMDTLGIGSPLLMERAALAVSHEVARCHGEATRPIVVLCGPGNNGADGVACARQLRGWGLPATVRLCGEPKPGPLREQVAMAMAMQVPIEVGFEALPPHATVVDGLLGTGSEGAPRGTVAQALRALAAVVGPRIAIDIPSGVDPDRGTAVPGAVTADVTVTFGHSKPGLHMTPGRDHAGRVVVADIGLVPAPGARAGCRLIDVNEVVSHLAGRPTRRHKGDRGHVGLVAGGSQTPGALLLACRAAFRTGAGLCTAVVQDVAQGAPWLAQDPELMLAPTGAWPLLARADALVVGPGLTDPSRWTDLPRLWAEDGRPAVWDATALEHIPPGANAGGPRVLTPHPGEAARMLASHLHEASWTGARVQADRRAAAEALAALWPGITVALKGAGTLVAGPQGVAIATAGTEALATAGAGDVLAGMVGALLAQGTPTRTAAEVAVTLHGWAGDIAARRTPGTRASDFLEAVEFAFPGTAPREIILRGVPSWVRA